MNKYIFIFCTTILIFLSGAAQKNNDCYLSLILKNQKKYCRKLNNEEKKYYTDLIYLAPWVRPKVIDEITKLCPAYSICDSAKFNILEEYDSPHGDIFGLIWVDSLFFGYTAGPSIAAKNNLSVYKRKLSSLSEEQRYIVSNFNDWENAIFKNKEGSARFISPPSYYLATKVNHISSKLVAQTITFCY